MFCLSKDLTRVCRLRQLDLVCCLDWHSGPGPAGGVGAPEPPPPFTPCFPVAWHVTRELDTHGRLACGTPVGSPFGTTTPLRPGMPPTVMDPF